MFGVKIASFFALWFIIGEAKARPRNDAVSNLSLLQIDGIGLQDSRNQVFKKLGIAPEFKAKCSTQDHNELKVTLLPPGKVVSVEGQKLYFRGKQIAAVKQRANHKLWHEKLGNKCIQFDKTFSWDFIDYGVTIVVETEVVQRVALYRSRHRPRTI